MPRRTALVALLTAGFVALALAPAVVTFGLGWLRIPPIQPWGAEPARDTTSLEAWVLFAVVYLFWMIGLAVLLVWTFDRVGHHWRYYERSPRPPTKARRRARATLQVLEAEQQAELAALRRRETRAALGGERASDEALGQAGEGAPPGAGDAASAGASPDDGCGR